MAGRLTEQNVVTETSFQVGRIDEYGIVLSSSDGQGTRYVVWEVLGQLAEQIRKGDFNKYSMPDADHPTRVQFSGDAMLFSLLRRVGLVEDVLENNRITFSVSSEVFQ